jgi:hypothetical protein
MGRFLILFGLVLVVAGAFWPFLARLGLGRLPGDIAIHTGRGSFYFPIASCLVISIVLSLLFRHLGR